MELLDVYNNDGLPTGKIVKRGAKDDEFSEGEHIAVAIIFIENSKNEFLIQKASVQKKGEYSSTGGHVDHNEKPLDAIIRETKEEIGIDISKEKVIDLGYIIVDFPVRFIYYLKKDINIKDFKLQKEEVESVSYMTIEEIRNIIKKGKMNKGHAIAFEYVLNCQNEIQ